MATKYNLHIDGTDADFARSKKETVIAEAKARLANKSAQSVQVVTDAGTVVFEAARRNITKHTKPYTLVTELPADLQTLVPEGYAAAYKRLRNGAIVLRREVELEEDDSRYAVMDVVAQVIAGYAETTRAAGKIMKSLGVARKAAKEAAQATA